VTGPVPAPDGRPRPRWGFVDVAVTLGGAILLGTLTAVALLGVEGSASTAQAKAWGLVVGLVVPWVALAGWPLYASKRKGAGPMTDFGLRLRWRAALLGVAGGVGALAVAYAVAAIQVSITGRTFDSAVGGVARDVASGSRVALVILALCTVVGAPVVEELAFRGLTYGAFRLQGQSRALSVVWTALLFAMFHFEPVRLPVLLVLGLFLGAVRARTGSTSASMVAHAVVNLPGALTILTLH